MPAANDISVRPSAARRSLLLKKLRLPERMSANAMLAALNALYSREELEKEIESL